MMYMIRINEAQKHVSSHAVRCISQISYPLGPCMGETNIRGPAGRVSSNFCDYQFFVGIDRDTETFHYSGQAPPEPTGAKLLDLRGEGMDAEGGWVRANTDDGEKGERRKRNGIDILPIQKFSDVVAWPSGVSISVGGGGGVTGDDESWPPRRDSNIATRPPPTR